MLPVSFIDLIVVIWLLALIDRSLARFKRRKSAG